MPRARGKGELDPVRVQNPHDPDATYGAKGLGAEAKTHVGYKAQVAETVVEAVLEPGEPTRNFITGIADYALRERCLGPRQQHKTIVVGDYHSALQARRREQKTEAFRQRMRHRNAIEGAQSELVRAHGLRRPALFQAHSGRSRLNRRGPPGPFFSFVRPVGGRHGLRSGFNSLGGEVHRKADNPIRRRRWDTHEQKSSNCLGKHALDPAEKPPHFAAESNSEN